MTFFNRRITLDPMASINRTHQFVVFLNDEEKAKLYGLANDDGTPASIVVRSLLKAEWQKRHGDKKPPKTKR